MGAPEKWGRKRRYFSMSYLNSVTIVGFVGADPEQRQARNNGSKFTVLSVATQRSWKNAEDEWVSKVEWHRVAIFRLRLAEAVLTNVKKGAHVLVEGSLISSTYEQANGKGKKAKTARTTRPRRSRRGRFAPMSCVGSIAASQNRKHRRLVRTLPCYRPTRVSRRRSDASLQKALRHRRRAFFTFLSHDVLFA